MAKDRTHAVFACESCGRTSVADVRKGEHILPFMRKLPINGDGTCRSCGGETWTLSVVYVDVERQTSAIGNVLGVATGFDFSSTAKHSNQFEYTGVPADIIARINEIPRDRFRRIIEFARAKEREKLKQQGGRECASCGTLFVPSGGQPWAAMGYCSKMCLVDTEGAAAALAFTEIVENSPARTNSVEIQCADGHRFDVQISFKGMLRPCPVCGAKTRVP